jgi:Uma2 family endonuclease
MKQPYPNRGDRGGLQQKMQEYLENGVKLGWLINPETKQVEVYRLERDVEILNSPNTLSGEAILPSFILDLSNIW